MKQNLKLITEQNPLILSLTNQVVMDFTANVLLALGASPLMSTSADELPELIAISPAIVLNIGTLNEIQIRDMHLALEVCTKQALILDPVGAGASKLRTKTCLDLLKTKKISVIKGNASEMLALANIPVKTKGVDSHYASEQAIDAARSLAEQFDCVSVITGKIDYITYHQKQKQISGGDSIMTKITGMGCIAAAIIAAFCSVEKNYFTAAFEAMSLIASTGEALATQTSGPASFKMHFIDSLYQQAFGE